MDTIVKYRFDREMVAFVKTLDVKSAMFGYDKRDVYSKFKDLLVRARDVCEALVMEENDRFEALRASLLQVADDPQAVRALLYDWEPGSSDIDPETEEDQDKQALLARLKELESRQELLDRAHDIVSEARLEREAIIRKAQTMAEEELFLFRAKRRDEESEFLAQLSQLEAEKAELEATYTRYREFVREGQTLFDQLQSYAGEIHDLKGEEAMPVEEDKGPIPGADLDPPVLSVDRHMGCTEESMPLCELAEDSPEGIFPDLDAPDAATPLENQPEVMEAQASCEETD